MFERRLSANVKLLAIVKLTAKLAYEKIKAVLPMYSFIMKEKWLGLTSITACKKRLSNFSVIHVAIYIFEHFTCTV